MKTLQDFVLTRQSFSWETIGAIHGAMEATADTLAAELEPETDPVMQSTCTTVSALRQPVSLASAYGDLCDLLGIPVPRVVVEALSS